MTALKRSLIALLVIPLLAVSVFAAKVEPAEAQVNLNDMIVLNGLFTGYNAQELAGLIAVDSITGGGTAAGATNINDLIVLNGLFGYNMDELAGLIVIDNMF